MAKFAKNNRAGDTAEQLEVELTNSELVILWLFMAILIIAGVVAGFTALAPRFPMRLKCQTTNIACSTI